MCLTEGNPTSSPLFDQAIVEVVKLFPDAYAAVCQRIDELREKLRKPKKGRAHDFDEEDGT